MAENLTVSRRKRLFFTVDRQKCRLIITVNKFPDISNLTILADFHGPLAPEESLNWKKPVPMFSKTLSLDITKA